MSGQKQKPVAEVRYGAIKAAIWANETQNGVRYNYTVSRLSKDDDGNWQETQSFGRDDALVIEKVSAAVFVKIHDLEQAGREARKAAAA